jgi:hypothetical protein
MSIPLNLEMYARLYPDADVIDWSEIYSGKKFHKARPAMLSPYGEAIPHLSRIKGDTAENQAQLRIIIFDRNYVIAKLAIENREIAANLTLEQFTELMELVYDKIQGK